MDDARTTELIGRCAARLAAAESVRDGVDEALELVSEATGLEARWHAERGRVELRGPTGEAGRVLCDALTAVIALAVRGARQTAPGALRPDVFEERLAAAIEDGVPLSLALFTVDGLDLCPAGERGRALDAIGGSARASVRADDAVGHVGGSRFALLLPGAGALEARIAFRRVREALAAEPPHGYPVEAPLAGYAERGDGGTARELLDAARERLERARQRRRYGAPLGSGSPLAG